MSLNTRSLDRVFSSFLDEAVAEVSQILIRTDANNVEQTVYDDLQEFLTQNKDKLEKWTMMLANQEIDQEKYEFLVCGLQDILVLQGLAEIGIAEVKLSKLKNSLLKLFVKFVFGMI